MDDFLNYMQNIVTPELLIYMAVALAALIILTILLKGMRKRRLKGMQAGLESQYNEIKGIPLAFKFNKAVALSRVNENMLSKVNECRPTFDAVQETLKECGVLLAEAEDLLFVRKNKAAARKMETLRTNLEQCRKDADHVNQVLDEILEQESEQRAQINVLKEKQRKGIVFREEERYFRIPARIYAGSF